MTVLISMMITDHDRTLKILNKSNRLQKSKNNQGHNKYTNFQVLFLDMLVIFTCKHF